MTPAEIAEFRARLKQMQPAAPQTQGDVRAWALRARIGRAMQELKDLEDLMRAEPRDLSKMAQDAFDEANRKAEK